ncbi:MAG: YjgN family protein [Syntrophorhabdaceae bacterium]|nr:YjgN family protein [Syntrophorhabdaceae bacterium]
MEHKVSFRGTGKEYFGIWIVNTLLKIVTFSVYTAWAKVRKRRYFAGKIFMDDEPFEYLASPRALFRGWLVAAAAIVAYTCADYFSKMLGIVISLIIMAFFPWVVVKSRIFNFRNQSCRNIRFGFAPKYAEGYRVMLGWPLLVPFTLGLLIPYVFYRQKKFLVENSSYGTTPFRFTATPREFYRIYTTLVFKVVLFSLVFIAVFVGVAMFVPKQVGIYILMFLSVLPFFLVVVYFKTAIANLVWNSTELGGLKFQSSMDVMDMCWLYFSGGVAVIFSMGLLFPWASVRVMRYRCERLSVHSQEGIGQFIADTASASVGAVGEEIGDLFGMDVDFGF